MKKFFNVIFLAIVFCIMLLFTGCSSKKYDVYWEEEKLPMYVEENRKGLFLHINCDCQIRWVRNSDLHKLSKVLAIPTDDDSLQNSVMGYTIYDSLLKTEKEIKYAIRVIDFVNSGEYISDEYEDLLGWHIFYYKYKKGTILELKNDDKNYDKSRQEIKKFCFDSEVKIN